MTEYGRPGVMVIVAALAAVIGVNGARVQAAPAAGQGSDKAAGEKTIIANEQKINEALAKGDLAAFKSLVASDGWSIDGGGIMPVLDFEKNIKQLKLEPGWKISDTKVIWVASNTAVLMYKWTGKGTYMGQAVPPVVFASTVWHRDGQKWAAVFHQESAAAK